MKKRCTKCGCEFPLSEFYRDRTHKDGFQSHCIQCSNSRPERTRGTVEYFVKQIWACMNQRTVNGRWRNENHPGCARYIRKGIELRLTYEEWHSWCHERKVLIERMYSQGITPSVGRIDHDSHYSLDNIVLQSLQDNKLESKERQRLSASRPVVGICVSSGERMSFPSLKAAARFVGTTSTYIIAALRGLEWPKDGIIKGYRWERI